MNAFSQASLVQEHYVLAVESNQHALSGVKMTDMSLFTSIQRYWSSTGIKSVMELNALPLSSM